MRIEKTQKQTLESEVRSIVTSYAAVFATALLLQCNPGRDNSIVSASHFPPSQRTGIIYTTRIFVPNIGGTSPLKRTIVYIDNFRGVHDTKQTQSELTSNETVLFEAR